MIDKASIAFCPNWLTKLVGSTAQMTNASISHLMLDSYIVLKTMERVGILPAVAFAQVITFLVSNDYKVHPFSSIRRNIRVVLMLAILLVGIATLMFCLWPQFFLSLLGKEKAFNSYIAYSLPFIAFTILSDVTQLILSASLRGYADVKTVMWTRVSFTLLFFVPFSYGISLIPLENSLLKFMLLYCSAHLNFALMSLVYYLRLRRVQWKNQTTESSETISSKPAFSSFRHPFIGAIRPSIVYPADKLISPTIRPAISPQYLKTLYKGQHICITKQRIVRAR